MPEEVEDAGAQGAARLERMPEAAGEYVDGAHLPRMADRAAVDVPRRAPIDIAEARRILDEDHYGLRQGQAAHPRISGGAQAQPARQAPDPVLRRAARRRQDLARADPSPAPWAASSSASASAACTTRPRSAATAAPISARCPARILQGIRRAGTRNCVMMLDEIDKLGRGYPGRPGLGAAGGARPRAELDLPRQLPRRAVRPVARSCSSPPPTCSTPIPGPLRDRMEVIELSGYTEDEKLEIARRYLVAPPARGERPEARAGRDHRRGAAARSSATTRARPACAASSARSARRCRSAAMQIAEGQREAGPHRSPSDLHESSGRASSRARSPMRTSVPGVATGLAWTPVGGDILFIEATRMPGQGRADPDRPARRGDARERAGGADAGQEPAPRRSASTRRRSRRATSTSTCRPAPSPRTAPPPASRCSPRSPRC